MKFVVFYLVLFSSFTIEMSPVNSFRGGTITYQAIQRYDYQTVFAEFAVDYPDWVNSIPTESEGQVTLTFTEKTALYDTRADEQNIPKQLRDAQAKAVYMLGPSIELEKVYYDLDKNEIVRQVDFMGRSFLIAGELKTPPWKLTNKVTKILDYTCMGAELEKDGKAVLAYFTSELPFPIGPDEFFGLPGLVLAVEIDGATAFLAHKVDLTRPDREAVAQPTDGKKVSQDEFEQIVADKTIEYKETKHEGNYHKK